MRSVSAQLSVAGVADQLHGKISEKLASAVWIRPVGRLSGHFTRKQLSAIERLHHMLNSAVDARSRTLRTPAWLPQRRRRWDDRTDTSQRTALVATPAWSG
jgi:hypothetical protein